MAGNGNAKSQANLDSARQDDPETQAIIYEGATMRQLAIMFKSDPKVVMRKVSGLVPVGRRRGTPVYSIPEAAARLVKPGYDMERYILSMNHTDLPPLLSKEFWNGQNARLKFEQMNGDLWPTTSIVRMISILFNTVRMILLLLPDTLEREAGLTREQKSVCRRVIDGALVDAKDKIVKEFKDYENGPVSASDGVGGESSGGIDPGPFALPQYDDTDDGGDQLSPAPEDEEQYCGL